MIDVKADKPSADLDREVKSALGPVAAKGKIGKFMIGTATCATPGE